MTPRRRAALGPGLGFGLVLFLLLEALPVETQYEYDFYDDFISGGDSGYDDYPYPDYRTDQAVPLNGFAAFRMPEPRTTLESVQARGYLLVGTYGDVPGFSVANGDGSWEGFDVDIGRAVATAVLGDPSSLQLIRVTSADRFAKLRVESVDMLASCVSWTSSRDREHGFTFLGPSWYDVQAYAVAKMLGIAEIDGLAGRFVAAKTATTSYGYMKAYFGAKGHEVKEYLAGSHTELVQAFQQRYVHGLTSDKATLITSMCGVAGLSEYIIIDDVMAKEVHGPVVRDDNGQWRDVVHWTLMAMITAEEMNITSANAPSMRDLSTDSRVRYLLGVEGNIGRAFGLDDAWVYNVISRVGNYGELYKRNLARFEKCGLSRGQNALIRDGGILHSPAFSEF